MSLKKSTINGKDGNVGSFSKKRPSVLRACLLCRSRKQKCDGEKPCFRCIRNQHECTYANSVQYSKTITDSSFDHLTETINSNFSSINHKIIALQNQIKDLQDFRNSAMTESNLLEENSTSIPQACDNVEIYSNDFPQVTERNRLEIHNLSLQSAPMATVQSMMSISEGEQEEEFVEAKSPLVFLRQLQQNEKWCCDPVILGLITPFEAQKLVDIYFKHLHYMAPLLTVSIYRNAETMRKKSTLLFLTVCSVAARSWSVKVNNKTSQLIQHPKYHDFAILLDFSLSQVIIYAKSGGITLEALEALQIYAHWMPFRLTSNLKNRINEIYSWNITGLAIRWAKFLDLEKKVLNAFCEGSEPGIEDFRILRILLNLVALDFQLMLSSGLPASIDPIPLATISRMFCRHECSEPDDFRFLGLAELAVALKHVLQRRNNLGQLDFESLKFINFFLDEWMLKWKNKIDNKPQGFPNVLSTQIPFTSLRWYRLTLNTLPLSNLFSGERLQEKDKPFILSCLTRSVQSATEMLSCFLVDENGNNFSGEIPTTDESWMLLKIDPKLMSQFVYSIDSYWMTHAFAIILLCVLYCRGVLNDHLKCQIPTVLSKVDIPPGEKSPLNKLLTVGCEIFENLNGCAWHPAYPLKIAVIQVYDSVIKIANDENTFNFKDLFSVPLDDIFDLGFIIQGRES